MTLVKRSIDILIGLHLDHPDWNMADFARKIGISRERVRQLNEQYRLGIQTELCPVYPATAADRRSQHIDERARTSGTLGDTSTRGNA